MHDERTNLFMRALTFRWNDIDFASTEQAKKIPVPDLCKPCDDRAERIPLPPVEGIEKPGATVIDAILARKSHRKFSGAALSAGELSLLLHCTQGVRVRHEKYSLRTVPSAGARHAFETYLYLDRIEGIRPGLYRYLPFEHALILERAMHDTMKKDLDEALNGQLFGAAAYFIWTAIPSRMEWRYSFASAKLLALDAGHVCENLYLVCGALGCGTCAIGAYDQTKMDRFLGVDGGSEFSLYMAPVGKIG